MPASSSPVPSQAVLVVQTFIDAGARQDVPAMKACLCRKTLASDEFHPDGPQGLTFTIQPGHMEGDIAVIPVAGTPENAPAGTPPVMEMPCVLVQEDGGWKIDLDASTDRMLAGPMGEAVEKMTEALTTAMEGVASAMSGGLTQALGSPADATTDSADEPGECNCTHCTKPAHDDQPHRHKKDKK